MRTKTSMWFESTARYDNGEDKIVMEQNVFEACSFTEAEARTIEELGSADVKKLTIAPYQEICFADMGQGFFKVVVAYITIDERTAKEKRTRITYLVEGEDINAARRNIQEVLASSMTDYEIVSIAKTKITHVYEKS